MSMRRGLSIGCVGPISRFARACGPVGLVAVAGTCWLGCGASSGAAVDTWSDAKAVRWGGLDTATSHDPTDEGAALFAEQCARCHGRHGEGIADAPIVLGPGALPEYPRDDSVRDAVQMEIAQKTRRTGATMRRPFRTAS